MDVITRTSVTHKIVIYPEADETLIMVDDSRTVCIDAITIHISTGAGGTLLPYQSQFEVQAHQVSDDGHHTRLRRTVRGTNLNRLPAKVVEAVLRCADDAGVLGLREDLEKTRRPSEA